VRGLSTAHIYKKIFKKINDYNFNEMHLNSIDKDGTDD
jgi:hypothetical protein